MKWGGWVCGVPKRAGGRVRCFHVYGVPMAAVTTAYVLLIVGDSMLVLACGVGWAPPLISWQYKTKKF